MKIAMNTLGLFVYIFLFSCGQNMNEDHPDSRLQENKNIVSAIYKMFETGDMNDIEKYVHEDMVDYTQDPFIIQSGVEGLKELIRINHIAFPDLKMKVFNISAEGDLVYSHFNFSGKNTGPIRSNSATMKSIDINGVDILRVKDGKIIEHWGYWDTMKLINQLGQISEAN